MILENLWHSLEASSVGDFVAASGWAFPVIESLHVIAIVSVVGMIAVMDLRLLGVASRHATVTAMSRDTLPITWVAFGVAAITGTLMFVSRSSTYVVNPYFQWKMVLLLLAGLNMAVFHLLTWRTANQWGDAATGGAIPLAGKVAGGLSLFFWVVIVLLGRVIGFTLGVYM